MATKSHRLFEMLKELRAHALWDGLKELVRWETVAGIPKYLGTIGGTLLAGIQWMGHHHGFLFILGVVVGGVSLVAIGVVLGRKPQTKQIQVQEHPPEEVVDQSSGEQKPKTVRFIQEESKTLHSGTQTYTTTVRQIVEISFAILICVGAGLLFLPEDERTASSSRAAVLNEDHTATVVGNQSPPPAIAEDSNKRAAVEGTAQSLGTSTSAKMKRFELQRKVERLEESSLASTTYSNDPDFPVWVVSDSDFYFCYGWEWEQHGRRLKGRWMKQSEARRDHKQSLTGLPCGLYSRVRGEPAQARAAQANEERMKAEAEKAHDEAELARREVDTARATAEQKQVLAMEADKARQAAEESDRLRQQAEKEKADLRAQLLQQLNTILATRDTAQGLSVNISDVLFKTGSYELLPRARERLAKVSGIVIAHPGLYLAVEGHTDSAGGDEYNQKLSENRARAVRDYLVQQGIPESAIVWRGVGKAQPVATNDNPDGRQQNRRVDLVLSGEAIGPKAAGAGASVPK